MNKTEKILYNSFQTLMWLLERTMEDQMLSQDEIKFEMKDLDDGRKGVYSVREILDRLKKDVSGSGKGES